MSRGHRLRYLPAQVIALVVVVTYAAIVWTLPRGFDGSDEAFVYTMIASNRVAVGEPWGFQHLLHPLYLLTGESVLAFRMLRLVGYVLLSVVLVRCARAVLGRMGIDIPRPGWTFILLFAQVGTFFAWSYPPHYLGYNELASWFAQLGVALVVLALSAGVSSSPPPSPLRLGIWRRPGSVWAGLGAVTTLLVFTKVSSGVALAVVIALALVIPNPHLRLLRRVAAVGGGSITVLFVLWVLGYPIVSYLSNAFGLLFDPAAQEAYNHSIPGLTNIYGDSLLYTGRALIPALLVFALAMATFHRKALGIGERPRRRVLDWVTWLLGALLLVALALLPRTVSATSLTRPEVWLYLGVFVVFIGAAGVIGLAVLGANGATMQGSAVSRSLSVAVGGLAIVAAPFISAVGTNNRIAGELAFAATLWSVVLGIALVLLTQRATLLRSNARALPALTGCLVVVMAALAVKGDIARPYRTAPLMSQGTSTSVPELRGILLTEADAAWMDWISAAGDSLGAHSVPATAIGSPGALYAFNQSGYANPWIDHTAKAALNSVSLACAGHPPADLFVLQPGNQPGGAPSTVALAQSLAACGVSFPSDFRVAAARTSADPKLAMTIWRLKG